MGLTLNAQGLLDSATSKLKSAGETIFKSASSAATSTLSSVGGYGVCEGSMVESKLKSYNNSSSKEADKTLKPTAKKVNPGDEFGLTMVKYPENIGTAMYPHYVNFYINVNSKSKLGRNSGIDESGNVTDKTKYESSQLTDIKTRKSQSAQQIRDITGKDGLGKILPGKFTVSYKRLKTAISLPLPAEIVSEYSAEYGVISTGGIVGSILQAVADGKSMKEAGAKAVGDIMQSAPGHVAKFAATVLAGAAGKAVGGNPGAGIAAGMAASAVDASNINALAHKAAGIATNERLEQTFKQINFRQFSFNYVLAPRNKEETEEIQKIIKMFKLHMHPEVGDGQAFLIMPDEFDIEFRFNSGINEYLHQIATCALTGVSVNSSPTGNYASFRESGAPVMISLQLRFTETTPLVREMIEKGY